MKARTLNATEQAVLFTQWRQDETVDNSMLCNRCRKYYDYRIFLVHKCEPVEQTPAVTFIPSV